MRQNRLQTDTLKRSKKLKSTVLFDCTFQVDSVTSLPYESRHLSESLHH